jgi:hypothetical protein
MMMSEKLTKKALFFTFDCNDELLRLAIICTPWKLAVV